MCLRAKTTVESWQAGLFVPVKKIINAGHYGNFITTYTRQPVTTFMNRCDASTIYMIYIEEQAIHSVYNQDFLYLHNHGSCVLIDAYAVGVFAGGYDGDVASIGIYYPFLDTENKLNLTSLKKMNYERRLAHLSKFVPGLVDYKKTVDLYKNLPKNSYKIIGNDDSRIPKLKA